MTGVELYPAPEGEDIYWDILDNQNDSIRYITSWT